MAQPISKERNYQYTVAAVPSQSIATNGFSTGLWVDTDGYDNVGLTLFNDAAVASRMDLQWSHDGATVHGTEVGVMPTGVSAKEKATSVPTKARYLKVVVKNEDASSHVISAWAYLKV